MNPGEPTQVRERPAREPKLRSSAAREPGHPAPLSAPPRLLGGRPPAARAPQDPSARVVLAGPTPPSRPRRGKEFPADSRGAASCPSRRAPSRCLSRTRPARDPLPGPATLPVLCSPGFCSSGRPAARAARRRGACGCSSDRWCGAGPVATSGGRRSGCCMPGRGPTQVTPGQPLRSVRGSPAPLCTPLPAAPLGKERCAGSQDREVLAPVSRLRAG